MDFVRKSQNDGVGRKVGILLGPVFFKVGFFSGEALGRPDQINVYLFSILGFLGGKAPLKNDYSSLTLTYADQKPAALWLSGRAGTVRWRDLSSHVILCPPPSNAISNYVLLTSYLRGTLGIQRYLSFISDF